MKALGNYRTKVLAVIFLILIVAVVAVTRIGQVPPVIAGEVAEGLSAPDSLTAWGANAETKAESASNDSVLFSIVKLLGALLLVVGAIYGFLYLLKRMMGGKLPANREQRLLEVLETTYVAPKKSVSLVRFAERAVLIGISDGQITPLAELSVEETTRALGDSTRTKNVVGFRNVLTEARDRIRLIGIGRESKS